MKYAAIDIGTNAARLLIGEVLRQNNHSCVQKISYTRVPLRLGFEVFNDGIISANKTQQLVKTMKAFKLIAEVYDVSQIRICATSAMREAKNSLSVQQQVKEEVGLNIEIIDGVEEADIIFSTFFLMSIDKEAPFIVIDVGGGSTEVSVFEDGKKIVGMSFSVGTIRLLKEKVDKHLWKEMSHWIKNNIDLTIPHKVFATGGNINKLHKLLNKEFMKPIKTKELNNFLDQLSQMTVEERMDKYSLKPDRADVIVPACEIYSFITKKLKCNQLFVPKIGLIDGMIYHMHKKS